MFKRLTYAEWQAFIPIAAFILTSAVFFLQVLYAFVIKRKQSEHMASLPLESDEQQQTQQRPATSRK